MKSQERSEFPILELIVLLIKKYLFTLVFFQSILLFRITSEDWHDRGGEVKILSNLSTSSGNCSTIDPLLPFSNCVFVSTYCSKCQDCGIATLFVLCKSMSHSVKNCLIVESFRPFIKRCDKTFKSFERNLWPRTESYTNVEIWHISSTVSYLYWIFCHWHDFLTRLQHNFESSLLTLFGPK